MPVRVEHVAHLQQLQISLRGGRELRLGQVVPVGTSAGSLAFLDRVSLRQSSACRPALGWRSQSNYEKTALMECEKVPKTDSWVSASRMVLGWDFITGCGQREDRVSVPSEPVSEPLRRVRAFEEYRSLGSGLGLSQMQAAQLTQTAP